MSEWNPDQESRLVEMVREVVRAGALTEDDELRIVDICLSAVNRKRVEATEAYLERKFSVETGDDSQK